MKTVLVSLLLLVSSSLALPRGIFERISEDPRNNAIETLILDQLEELRQTMVEGTGGAGVLDPLQEDELRIDLNELGIGGHLNIHRLVLNYLSTFEVNHIQFGYLTRRLDFQVSIPVLELLAENYDLLVQLDGIDALGNGPATIRVHNIRVVGTARILPSIIGGVSLQVQDCHLTLHIGQFEPQIEGLLGNGPEVEFVNGVLANLVPELVEFYEAEISEFLNGIFEDAINGVLQDL